MKRGVVEKLACSEKGGEGKSKIVMDMKREGEEEKRKGEEAGGAKC